VAYSTLLKTPRRNLHAQIAALLSSNVQEVSPEVIARHYEEAGDVKRAIAFWTRAGDLAELRAASLEATRHYRHALRLFESTSPDAEAQIVLNMKLSSIQMQLEGYGSAGALTSCQIAQSLAKSMRYIEHEAYAVSQMSPLLISRGKYSHVIEAVGSMANAIPTLPPRLQVQLLVPMGIAKYELGDFRSSFNVLAEAITIDDKTPCTHEYPTGGGDPAIVVREYASETALILGDFEASLKLAEDALAIGRIRNHPFSLAWALLTIATVYHFFGRYDDALSACDEGTSICKRFGFTARETGFQRTRGAILVDIGDIDQGLELIKKGIKGWSNLSGHFHATEHLARFVDCLFRAGKGRTSDEALSRAESLASEAGEQCYLSELKRLRGLHWHLIGNVEAAVDCLQDALAWSEERQAKLFELRAAKDLFRISKGTSREQYARTRLMKATSMLPSEPIAPILVEARHMIAE
jgi:tetratricopeptide (TPR) repeat protein